MCSVFPKSCDGGTIYMTNLVFATMRPDATRWGEGVTVRGTGIH
jgi:hypothetical protein